MQNPIKIFTRLRWWNKIFLTIISLFLYFVFSGLYYKYTNPPHQNNCEIVGYTPDEYQSLMDGMSYDYSKFRHDLGDFESLSHQAAKDRMRPKLKKQLNAALADVKDFNQAIAITHALTRKIGYYHFDTVTIHKKTGQLYDLTLQFKRIRSKFTNDFFDLITRVPTTIYVEFTPTLLSDKSEASFVRFSNHVGITSSTRRNFAQNSKCPTFLPEDYIQIPKTKLKK